jgi:hypothetical protein
VLRHFDESAAVSVLRILGIDRDCERIRVHVRVVIDARQLNEKCLH